MTENGEKERKTNSERVEKEHKMVCKKLLRAEYFVIFVCSFAALVVRGSDDRVQFIGQ